MADWVVFEDKQMRDACRAAFASLPTEHWLSWEEALELRGEAEPEGFAEASAAFQQSLRQAPAETGDWWLTVEQLRGAPLNTPEDVDFCFSFLPETPKNQFLQKLVRLYVESELATADRVARTLRLIEACRHGESAEPAVFIRGASPSPLFAEWAGLSSGIPGQSALRETWEWEPEPVEGALFSAVPLSASAVTSLDRLAAKAAAFSEKGIEPRLHFSGSAASSAYLRCRLASHGISNPQILPLHPLPGAAGSVSLFFLQTEERETNRLALDSLERRRLRDAGFHLPEAEPKTIRHAEYLQTLKARSAGHRFFFHAGEAPNGDWKSLAPRPSASEKRRMNYICPPNAGGPLSASSLDKFADCPTQFYFSHRLRLAPRLDTADSFALIFGNLVHGTLEKVFKLGSWREATPERLEEIFQTLVEERRAEWTDVPWFEAAFKKRFAPIAAQVLRLETDLRTALGELNPYRFEEAFEIETSGLRLRGRWDRVDQTAQGQAIVIDYKTGTVDFSPEQIKKGTEFQALIYALAARSRFGSVAGVLFYDLKQGEVRRGLARADALPPTAAKALTRGHTLSAEAWDALLETGEKHLTALGQRLAQPEHPPTPSDKACDRCGYGDLCRQRHGWTGGLT
ncbi:PD-(D/E)XK nuclease family protein [bacterium]|nr:PD-(D/E)XK nuclease family protein [bacterium]